MASIETKRLKMIPFTCVLEEQHMKYWIVK